MKEQATACKKTSEKTSSVFYPATVFVPRFKKRKHLKLVGLDQEKIIFIFVFNIKTTLG